MTIPWLAVLPDHPENAQFTTLLLKNIPPFTNSWSTEFDNGNWTKWFAGLVNFTQALPCPTDLDSFWPILEPTFDLSKLESYLCQNEILIDEWTNYDLLNAIYDIILEAQNFGSYETEITFEKLSKIMNEILESISNLNEKSKTKNLVYFDGLDEKLMKSFENFLNSLLEFFQRFVNHTRASHYNFPEI